MESANELDTLFRKTPDVYVEILWIRRTTLDNGVSKNTGCLCGDSVESANELDTLF